MPVHYIVFVWQVLGVDLLWLITFANCKVGNVNHNGKLNNLIEWVNDEKLRP